MPVNEAAEAAYRAGKITYHQLHVANQNPAALLGGLPPPYNPATDQTRLNAQAGEAARYAMREFLATHKAIPPEYPGGPMRWRVIATGEIVPASAAPPI